jgi:hypothetical protein
MKETCMSHRRSHLGQSLFGPVLGVLVAGFCLIAPLAAQREAPLDLPTFQKEASLAHQLGATHMVVTDGLPLATWEMDPDDPYPMWFVHHAGILTIFPPKILQPFVNAKYSADVSSALAARCQVLAKYGLKGVWNSNEPAVLPEAFFAAHPELRGPRIDQPNRSRKVYFAPSVDEPATLEMYTEAIQHLLTVCPQVEQFNWTTTDAGSGFDWTPSLYPGINGNTKYRNRTMGDRVSGFLINAQQAARESGHEIQIDLRPIEPRQWMIPTFSPDVLQNIVRELPRGLAVDGKEGPDGRPFAGVAAVRTGGAVFYPVVGLVIPAIESGSAYSAIRQGASPGPYLINFGDDASVDANFRLFKFVKGAPLRTLAERTATLRAFAVSEVGEQQADNLLEVWTELNDVQLQLQALDFGPVLRMGDVLNRWITRPMVPFPEDLTPAEKKDYRTFLFQAKGDAEANDLIDIQAMRMYEGWGAKMLFQRTIELTQPKLLRAHELVLGIAASANDASARAQWELMGKRLLAVSYLLRSADNMVGYQAQLDRVKALGRPVEQDPVLGVQSSWDRTDLMETARREIDAMVALNQLLTSTHEPILDLAASPTEETIMRLGPDTPAEIRHKIEVMNAHWRDYGRLFTEPNP